MFILTEKNQAAAVQQALRQRLEGTGVTVAHPGGEVLVLEGETFRLDGESLRLLPGVRAVQRLAEPYPLAARTGHPADTVVSVGKARIGRDFCLIAGPCAVESPEQVTSIARQVSAAGAQLLRGGAFKPRTSPYTFGGLGAEGLELLCRAGRETGLPVVSEITDPRQLPLFREVDVLQVGARNMQNFELLRELGRQEKPVLLKRSFGATVTELLQAAEYILAGGNERVILCERGIRTFETDSRATLDVAGIAALKEQSHLPVLADPSHAAGRRGLVAPLALAAAAAGADGLMIEVHDRPEEALSDGRQALTCGEFARLARRVQALTALLRQEE
ncbi:MAG: 3-deoxy-7-phosphoheptulonate synthase [Oscillospiraceae bacterium]|nr:3-deoxy-7-phosphoheptulonate synthase [Oscillospiraceae bacterium]